MGVGQGCLLLFPTPFKLVLYNCVLCLPANSFGSKSLPCLEEDTEINPIQRLCVDVYVHVYIRLFLTLSPAPTPHLIGLIIYALVTVVMIDMYM